MKFLKIYRSVKEIFVKPKIKLYIGTWKKEPNLPVWRYGTQIRLSKRFGYNSKSGKYYCPNNRVSVLEGYSDHEWNGQKIKKYGWSNHKLPNNLTPYSYVWNRRIRKKLRKWHLSWIPPVIQLPIWTAFHFYDNDIMWKTKYDDYRYEFPGFIGLVIFGLSISLTAYIPKENEKDYSCNDDYWESILNYQEYKDLKKVHEIMGVWNTIGTNEKRIRFNPRFLKEPYRSELIKIQNVK